MATKKQGSEEVSALETPDDNKNPEPKVGEVGYDWASHYGDAELYTHTFPNGTVVAIKTFGSIYSKTWLYKIRDLPTETDIQFAAIDRAACETAKAVLLDLDDTDGDPIEDLWKAWTSAGTSDGGEGLTSGE